MPRPPEELVKVIERIGSRGYITVDDALAIERCTGYSFSRILDEVAEGRAKEYVFRPSGSRLYFYTGREKEYLLLPEVWYCSCMSRHPSNLLRRRICHHLIAHWIARALGRIRAYEADDEDYSWIVEELL
ncbi:hypothetical protein B6U99_02110 [Candidatus Geothermarchaeota archaeon ex4572_27]|nr:MAG: hypothetical protein B6U99_02110 [Candidatus Geothermarchaeota archaeon ex4572_27]